MFWIRVDASRKVLGGANVVPDWFAKKSAKDPSSFSSWTRTSQRSLSRTKPSYPSALPPFRLPPSALLQFPFVHPSTQTRSSTFAVTLAFPTLLLLFQLQSAPFTHAVSPSTLGTSLNNHCYTKLEMVRNNIQHDAAEDYEAQRQANIKANLELMMSLGLYQSSTFLNPKPTPSTPKAKSSPKPKSAAPRTSSAAASEDGEGKMERPKRITRSVSRVLDDSRLKRAGRGMKRASSDEGISSRKTTRYDPTEYNPDAFLDSDDDSPYYSSRKSSSRTSNSLNPSRSYRDKADLQRSADRLGTRIHNPKTFGAIPGIPIGTIFAKRIHASTAAIHAPTVAGISGNEHGCWSICLSGDYEDDIDSGHTFTYTGSGGRDLKGTVNNPKNLRTAPQSSDQR